MTDLAVTPIGSEDVQASLLYFTAHEKPSPNNPFVAIEEAAEGGDGAAQALLVILSALRDTISECRMTAGGKGKSAEPSATEYLAAILPALECCDQSHTPQLLALLAAAMPHAHRSLLRHKFPAIALVLTRLLEANKEEGEDEASGSGSANVLQRILRCIGYLLAAQETSPAVWSSPGVLRGFHALLHFFADRRSKVRRAAHEAVVDILTTQGPGSGVVGKQKSGNSSKGPAAQTVEICRAVVSSCTSQDAMRAMHLLQFMRLAVPQFQPKQASSLCELALTLLPLESPPLTAAVMQMLSAVVQSPRPCMDGQSLTKLTEELLKLQPSRSAGAGAVAFAPLLASCLVRLQNIPLDQSMGSNASTALLARSTHALVDYCESSSSTVHTAACGGLNLMFQSCVDQGMVTQMAGSLGRGDTASAGGPLSETLSALESLLQYRFQRSWPKSLPLLGRLFLHLRGASFSLLVGVLRGLGELHDALSSVPSAALPGVTPALNEAIAFAIQGMGAERVLSVLPLAPAGSTPVAEGGVAESRAWLLPLLTEHARAAPSRLVFFQEHVLSTAKACDGAAKSGRLTANQARTQRFRVVQLWGLLPGFCARPIDVASAFGSLAPVLANAMQDASYPGILPEVCAGLQVLVTGVKARVEGGDQAAKVDLEKLSNTATRFLPKMFALVDPGGEGVSATVPPVVDEAGAVVGGMDPAAAAAAANERTAAVCGAAAALASVCPAPYLSSLFKKLLHKLIQATAGSAGGGGGGGGAGGGEEGAAAAKAAALSRAQVLLELATGLAPSLDDEGISLLYRAAKPLVRDDASRLLQKRAYKVLLAVCTHRPAFMSSADILPDVLELFTSSLLTCHVSARVMRLQCLSRLTSSLTPGDPVHVRFLPAATLEVVLCTKASNGRTRKLANSVLVLMALARGNPADTVRTVVESLAGATPHGRSAGILALGHLQLEFGHFRSERWDARVADMMRPLTQTMLPLLKEPSREVVEAVLGWLRVAVGGADREVMRPMVGDIVLGVMSGTTPRHKDHFRVKIRLVLSKLCRKFGFEAIKELMPEQDKKLVAHMQTTAERELKAKKLRLTGGGNGGGHASGGAGGRGGSSGNGEDGGVTKALRTFDAIMDSDVEDGLDSEDEHPASLGDGKKGRNGKFGNGRRRRAVGCEDMMVRERGEDGTSVVDLLDASMVRNMKISCGGKSGGNNNQGGGVDFGSDFSDGDDDGPELSVNKDGKFVIPGGDSDSDDSGDDNEKNHNTNKRGKNKRSRDSNNDVGSDNESVVDTGKDARGFVHIAGRRARAQAEAGGGAVPAGARGRSVPGAAGGGGGRTGGGRDAAPNGKRQKTGVIRGTATGAEFRSKKAGGDVKRKGAKLEPYAYIPLDSRTLTGKKSAGTALKQYDAVVGASARGGKKGYQQRRGGQRK